MKSKKILDSEIGGLKVASLPTRPNASAKYGGYAYSAAEMKAAFDKLPLFIINRFNTLIDDITSTTGGIKDSVMTGLGAAHTLSDFFSDVTSGALASYLLVLGKSLDDQISELDARIKALENAISGG